MQLQMHTPPVAKGRRRVGLLLLLAGLALAAGGFFLPWLSINCSAHCEGASWPLIRGPVATDGLLLFACWPAWLLVLVFALLTALQEFRPAARRGVAPALLLAGMLLVVQAIALLLLSILITHPDIPVLTYDLLPGCAVSPLGTLLVAIGGWLRDHPGGITPSPTSKLAEVPPER
jgi:hypothetical protein